MHEKFTCNEGDKRKCRRSVVCIDVAQIQLYTGFRKQMKEMQREIKHYK